MEENVYSSSIFNAIAADDLAMQAAMASATMVLTSQYIPASATGQLIISIEVHR